MLGELWLLTLFVVGVAAVWSGDMLLTLTVMLTALISASLLVWRRYCLSGVAYRRRLGTTHAAFGETVALRLELTNLKPLPLTWLRIEDAMPNGLSVEGGTVQPPNPGRPSRLSVLAAMLPYERVTRRLHIRCDRRGELQLGPATLESGDYLGVLTRRAAHPGTDRLIVYPKLFPVHFGKLPSNRLLGRDKAHRGFLPDPVRGIGAREYRAGDPYRSIDWRSSARSDMLMVRVAEPSTTPLLDIVLSFDTTGFGAWEQDALEFAISVAASVARHAVEQRWAVGLCGNGDSGGRPIGIRPSGAPQQLRLILEALARADASPTGSLAGLLVRHTRTAQAGSTLLLITTRLESAERGALHEIHRRGWPLLVVLIARTYKVAVPDPFPVLRLPYDEAWTKRDALVLGA